MQSLYDKSAVAVSVQVGKCLQVSASSNTGLWASVCILPIWRRQGSEEMMASRIAERIKGQDNQARQHASIQRGCVRTVHTNALRVEKEVTAKQIVYRASSLSLALLLLRMFPCVPWANASGEMEKERLQAAGLLKPCL